MARECAWSGDEFDGKGYIVQTTEGPEVVSEKALRESRGTTDKAARKQIDDLEARLDELARQVKDLTDQVTQGKGASR